MDYKSGHHRRYQRDASAAASITEAGFELVDLRYLDVLGVAPYFAMYKLLDVKTLGSVSSNGYDRVIVPISRAVQRLVPDPPFGKNLLAIARRPHEPYRGHLGGVPRLKHRWRLHATSFSRSGAARSVTGTSDDGRMPGSAGAVGTGRAAPMCSRAFIGPENASAGQFTGHVLTVGTWRDALGDHHKLLVEDHLELLLLDERVDERSVEVARWEQRHVEHHVLDNRRAREPLAVEVAPVPRPERVRPVVAVFSVRQVRADVVRGHDDGVTGDQVEGLVERLPSGLSWIQITKPLPIGEFDHATLEM